MSHFSVAVFTDGKKSVEELLAPYDENIFQNNKTGLKILDYDNLLYPQYENSFISISSKIWKSLK